ncbi:putrescine transport system permease protein [Palleronia salina]|uniref:Putrescine transport system permease protein n=2 Tax=Palleronia salina TaxID=313368 RepID=A0A1M6LPP8_9RHOB|nr:ABC transporter permease subunit [Palleronia salina]SHJ73167.1 putrescine transport system permease protein [Palleronia salina]
MKRLVALIPMAWLGLFFLVPFLVLLKISVSEPAIAQPPYMPLLDWADGILTIALNLGNYIFLTEDPLYLLSYLSSVKIAAISTILTLLLGYPMAYVIARAPEHRRGLLLMLVILPFWTSFLLRVYAWIGLLKANGIVNNALLAVGVIDQPLVMLQTDFAVYLGIVYTYLPFMILPLYATLSKLDADLLDASADLGARPGTTFLTVTLPLSLPGVVAGSMLVFIPAVGEYIIPALLGGPGTLMIGSVLWNEFFLNRDWPVAAAVAIVMVLVLALPIGLLRRVQAREGERP